MRVDQQRQHREDQRAHALREQQQRAARIAVGEGAGERREQQQRHELDAAREAQLHHRIGDLINQPAAAQLVHPEAEVAEDLAHRHRAEVAVVQGFEGAVVAEGREEGTHGRILAGWRT
jgi:hypothetical protein